MLFFYESQGKVYTVKIAKSKLSVVYECLVCSLNNVDKWECVESYSNTTKRNSTIFQLYVCV